MLNPDMPILSVEQERHFRLLMDAGETAPARDLFIAALRPAPVPDIVLRALDWAGSIQYAHGSVASAVYLNHPLRVATLLAAWPELGDAETLATALIHNVLEVSSITKDEIAQRLNPGVAEAVQALTVDRARQYDAAYKDSYYARIEATSPYCARVKAADKLDNIYMLCFNPDEHIRKQYLDEIDARVIPMAERTAPVLAAQLRTATMALRGTGFLDKNNELKIARRNKRT